MEIKNIEEIKNPVFERKEVELTVLAEITPSYKEALGALAKKFSVSEDSIKIKGIYGKFGIKEFEIKAHVYKSKEEKDKIEKKTKKEIEEEKKAVEAAKKAAQEAKKAKEAEEAQAKEKKAEGESKGE